MKKIVLLSAIGLMAFSAPAFAGGRGGGGLAIGANVGIASSGRGGLVGSLLGGGAVLANVNVAAKGGLLAPVLGRGGLAVNANVLVKGGLLGGLLGGGGHSCGCN